MAGSYTRRGFVRASARTIGGLTLLGAAGCGTGAAGSNVSGKLRIPLANSFIGNAWRLEMENIYRATLQMEPYRSQVFGSVYNSSNDQAKQAQQISNLVSAKVDAILIDAASPTGLDGIVGQAIDRGILVLAFDNTVQADGALSVNTDQFAFGKQLAEWVVKSLKGKGNVLMVTGVAGTYVDTQRTAGGMSVFKKESGVKIVGKVVGNWDSAAAQRNVAAVLPSLPKVDAIWAQGGTDGVLKAFKAAGRELPPTAGEAENGFRKFMSGDQGGDKLEGYSIGQPPYLVAIALEAARRMLKGDYPRKDVVVPLPALDSSQLKAGESVFPDLQDSYFNAFTDTSDRPLVTYPLREVQTGIATRKRIDIRLPEA